MNKYQIFLFLLIFNTSLKVWADNYSKNNPPQAVKEAMQEVVFILKYYPRYDGYGAASGFIIRDDKNRAILVTAYHVLDSFIEEQYPIIVIDAYGKRLKVKKVLSYSTKIDTAFLELESYDRQGLKLDNSHFSDSGDAFVLGFFGNQRHLLNGANLKTSSKDFFNIIIDKDFDVMGGFSGSPVLNEYGEVMGVLVGGDHLYKYSYVVKNTNMKTLLDSPKKKTSAIDQILYEFQNHFFPFVIGRGNIFSNKSNFQRLQAMSNKGSFNAQKTLKHLDEIQLRQLGFGMFLFAGFAVGFAGLPQEFYELTYELTGVTVRRNVGLLQAETLRDILFLAPSTAFFGYTSFNYCADAFTHFKNKILSRIQKN